MFHVRLQFDNTSQSNALPTVVRCHAIFKSISLKYDQFSLMTYHYCCDDCTLLFVTFVNKIENITFPNSSAFTFPCCRLFRFDKRLDSENKDT